MKLVLIKQAAELISKVLVRLDRSILFIFYIENIKILDSVASGKTN